MNSIDDAIEMSEIAEAQAVAAGPPEERMAAKPLPPADQKFTGRVLRVHDGDTLVVLGPATWPVWWRTVAVRLFGIDAPEMHDTRPEIKALADKAHAMLASLLPVGSSIDIHSVTPDKYGGRVLGIPLEPNGADACQAMLAAGLARPYAGVGPKPW